MSVGQFLGQNINQNLLGEWDFGKELINDKVNSATLFRLFVADVINVVLF